MNRFPKIYPNGFFVVQMCLLIDFLLFKIKLNANIIWLINTKFFIFNTYYIILVSMHFNDSFSCLKPVIYLSTYIISLSLIEIGNMSSSPILVLDYFTKIK